MRALIQRVSKAHVKIDGKIKSEIGQGLVCLLGIEKHHNKEDIPWLIKKILQLRIFSDEEGKMNLSVQDVFGEILVISQFTLFASTKKGNRPSFIGSENPELAEKTYLEFIDFMESLYPNKIKTGEFGGDMKVSLTNDGPVTIMIDSNARE
ncbi:D-aminoacyl-tRNA deacylase [Membranihabitans marinus]|uniref:D-aminoacyl-tRNA deacylase n=1 Tax=Membranihabitans marinus TaxID=1227546 RepID=UPI001F01CA2B|nr:D-aminoacyl-tRNA deacylase [Membranihabitans marinus]